MAIVLVTGAAGFIGMHVSIRLIKEGWNVVGIDNLNPYYEVQLKRDRLTEIFKEAKRCEGLFEFLEKDLNSDVWSELEKRDFVAVVHLAAQAGVRYSLENPVAYLESNIFGFHRVLDYVQRKGIQRFVYASSSSVYGENAKQPFEETDSCSYPESYYAATKRANELMAYSYYRTFGVGSIGLRFFTVYGPWGRPDMAPMLFASAAYTGRNVNIYNYGRQRRDFTFIDDIVESVYRLIVLENIPDGAVVCNIGYGSPTNLMEFVELIEKFTNREIKKTLVEAQLGDVTETYCDNSKLKMITGFSPTISLKEGIRQFVNWYNSYNKFV